MDYGTAHNPVRMCLQWKEGGEKYEWSDDLTYVETPKDPIYSAKVVRKGGPPQGVKGVFIAVQKQVEKSCR